MNRNEVLSTLKRLNACDEAIKWVSESKCTTLAEIWAECHRGDWMLWLTGRVGVAPKLLVSAACLCAREVLAHVQAGEHRPRLAIEAAERWVRGEATREEVLVARVSAYAASADAADAAAAYASDAAYSASYAAAYDAAVYASAYAATAADSTAAYAAYASAAAYVYASDAAAAYASAYAAARKKSLQRSADIVRGAIPYSTVLRSVKGAAQ